MRAAIVLLTLGVLANVCGTALGQCDGGSAIAAPPGFSVDFLLGRQDNTTPRIEAIRDPAFGFGVITASGRDQILTLRRVSDGESAILATITGFTLPLVSPRSVRFDNGSLYLAARDARSGSNPINPCSDKISRTKFYEITPGGNWSLLSTLGDLASVDFDFVDPSAGYGSLGVGYDSDCCGGCALISLDSNLSPTVLGQNPLPPGRTDLNIAGMEFDRTAGVYGNELWLADNGQDDPAQVCALYRLSSNLQWTEVVSVSNNTRLYGDIAFASGGVLGERLFVTNMRDNTIETVDPNGTHAVWATGLVGALSISAASDGDSLFVSDANGVYRIRPSTTTVGPRVIIREPSAAGSGDVFIGDPIDSVRLLFNRAVVFQPSDVTVVDDQGGSVPFTASGSGTQFMLISFGQSLAGSAYTLTLSSEVRDAETNASLDGDDDGTAGGDYRFVITHKCDEDVDGSGTIDLSDLAAVLAVFGQSCN